jgi:uncharacterized protein (DUF1697 family)
MARLVALLRGINLGPARRVPMADLRALIGELGYEDVRTVLQSGNIVFTGEERGARAALEAALADRYGFDIDVIVRTMDELHAVVEADPLRERVTDLTRSFVVFFPEAPDADALAALEAQDFAPDVLAAGRRELYTWCPNGMRNSRLMRILTGRSQLADTATVRNMSTVNKLLE